MVIQSRVQKRRHRDRYWLKGTVLSNRRRVWRTRNHNVPFPTYPARAVCHEPSLSVRALAYLSMSLSRSFVSIAMSDRRSLMSSAFQCSREKEVSEPPVHEGRLEVPHKGSRLQRAPKPKKRGRNTYCE